MNRLLVYRIIDGLILTFSAIVGFYLKEYSYSLFVMLLIPPVILLYLSWKKDSAWFRILATFALLYSLIYTSAQSVGIGQWLIVAVVTIFLRPPLTFLRTTVYSLWFVVIYLFWQNSKLSAEEEWNIQFTDIFLNLNPYIFYVLLLGFVSGLYLNYFERGVGKKNLYVIVIGILGFFVLVPFNLLIGSVIGLYQSLYVYWFNFLLIFRVEPVFVGTKYENYLVHKGIEDWKGIWKANFKLSRDKVSKWKTDIKNDFSNYTLILAIYYSITKLMAIVILALTCLIINIMFGSIYFILLACFIVGYHLVRSTFYNMDALYRKKSQVEMICAICHHKDELPMYVCSHCNSAHDDLKPGKYGIFKRKCSCGQKMPTSILNGRSELPARCPNCHSHCFGKESTPVVIPIIGGKMVGKTSFWTTAIQTMSNNTFNENGISFTWGSPEQESEFGQLITRVNSKLAPPATNELIPTAWTFYLRKKKWVRDKIVYLYDPAGAVFDRSDLMKKMKYMSYADGIIFVIDSMTVTPRNSHYEERNVGDFNAEEIIDRLLLYYQEELGIKVHEKITTPLAIVFHKVDGGMEQRVAKEVSSTQEGINGNHEACKNWLKANGSHNFLRKLDHQFTNYRFFTSSALSESDDVQPAKVMAWIMSLSKKGLKLMEKGE